MPAGLPVFLAIVIAAGAAAIAHSAIHLEPAKLTIYVAILSALTIASGRFAIKVPGQPATVSVSELFVFASILLAGPSVPVLTVAIDGLWTSVRQRKRRAYRTFFNIAEPAISVWTAGQVFFAILGTAPGSTLEAQAAVIVAATGGMAAVFFALNSGLNALAVALESGGSAFSIWRSHAWYLAINDYAAASLAALAIASPLTINYAVVGLAAPLLILSYVAYREASVRADQSRQHIESVERLYRASVEMLAMAVDTKDQITHGHIRRVQRHTLAVAKAIGIDDARELKAIEAGALLHDIGKLAVPDYVLNKPSALTPAEFETMKKHATMGARILTAVDFPYPVVPIVRHHHERWDGRGYPDGLCGSEVPIGARILAVVDCFDALTSDRPYRAKMSDQQAADLVRSRAGTFYDPQIVDRFIAMIPELRSGDALAEQHDDARASVVVSLARPAGSNPGDAPIDTKPRHHLPFAARNRIDTRMLQRGTEACLYALDTSGDFLTAAYVTPAVREAFRGVQIPVGSGVSGWVASHRSSIRIAEAALDVGQLVGRFGLIQCSSVPVFVGGDLFGVLTVYAHDVADPDEQTAAVGRLAQEIGLLIATGAQALPHTGTRAKIAAFAAVS